MVEKYQNRIKELTKQLQYHKHLAEQYYLELKQFTQRQGKQAMNQRSHNQQNPQPSVTTGPVGGVSRDSIPIHSGWQGQNNVDYQNADMIQANLYTDHWHDGNTTDDNTTDEYNDNVRAPFDNTYANLNSYIDNHSSNRFNARLQENNYNVDQNCDDV